MSSASEPTPEQDLPRELREALDSMTTPDPRPEFRSQLRQDFVAGQIRCSDTLVESALDVWNVPPARDEFRASCREAFLAGAGSASEPEAARGKLLRFLPLAAAAAVVALLVPELFGGSSRWEKLDQSPFVVNGTTVSETSSGELDRLLGPRGSCSVDRGGEKVLLRYDNGLLVEADPGTDFTVEESDDASRALKIDLARGAIRVSNRPEYERSVEIRTPDADIELRGEAIGVDVLGDRGTCVCCLGGEVLVDPVVDGAESFEVEGGSSIWLPRGSTEIKLMQDELHHRDTLEQIRNSARKHFY